MAATWYRRFSINGAIALSTAVILLMVTLTVLWNVVLVHDYNRLRELTENEGGAFHWTMIALGSALFVLIIVLSCILITQLVGTIRWNQRQSNFIASVSHEMNSPLSSIRMFAQTLGRDGITDYDRRNFVSKIVADVDRLTHIVSNILRAAEVDHHSGALPVVLEPVDLLGHLEEFGDYMRSLPLQRVDLAICGDRDVVVEIDRFYLRQVLDNLVDNAIRYRGNAAAMVTIDVRKNGQSAVVEVRDQGMGIASAELPKLFDRFYRIEPGAAPGGAAGVPAGAASGRARKGLGIGLSVVRSIVESHGGSVEARSEGQGEGTTIRMLLPIAGKKSPRVEGEAEL